MRAPGPRLVATLPLAAGGLQPGHAHTLASQWPADLSGAGWGCAASIGVASTSAACLGDPLRASIPREMPVDPGSTCTGGDHALFMARKKMLGCGGYGTRLAQLDNESGGGGGITSMSLVPMSRCIALSFAGRASVGAAPINPRGS